MKKRLASLHRDFYRESQDDGILWFDADYKKFMTQLSCETTWKVRWYRLIVSHLFQRIWKSNHKWDHLTIWPSTPLPFRRFFFLFQRMLPTCGAGARVMARVLWCLAAVAAGQNEEKLMGRKRCETEAFEVWSWMKMRLLWNYNDWKSHLEAFEYCIPSYSIPTSTYSNPAKWGTSMEQEWNNVRQGLWV